MLKKYSHTEKSLNQKGRVLKIDPESNLKDFKTANRMEAGIQERDLPSKPRFVRKHCSSVCSHASESWRVFSGCLCKLPKCWPETEKLTVIFLSKIGSFDVSRVPIQGLQPRWAIHESSAKLERRTLYITKSKKEVEKSIVSKISMVFIGWVVTISS